MLIAVAVLAVALVAEGAGINGLAGSCPAVCNCKWKGGKQSVECVDRALITLPALIDPETQVLDMSDNNLQILPRESFVRAGLHNLQKVYLRNCKLGQIDDEAFKGLTNLIELDLSKNLLTSVPSSTFNDVPFLRDLTLAFNPIQKIDGHAFQTVPNLVKLDLSHCDLQSIAPKAFEGVTLLELLKLNNNKLTDLRPRTVESLSKLHGVELHDNLWVCDCRLRSAKMWLTENNIPYTVAPVCVDGPTRTIDRTFGELHVDDFACKPDILPVNRYVEATTGENATVTCRADAVPPPTITWYLNGKPLSNNTVFGSYQKVFIFEEGKFEKKSMLVLTNAQETDSSEFYCVAENKAGSAEANFTLHVSMRTAGMATLGSGQIIGLSAVLFAVILLICFIIMALLMRLRRTPFSESKTPGQLEVVTTVNGTAPTMSVKAASPSPTAEAPPFAERRAPNDLKFCNPVQKPPRLTDMPYTTNHYDGHGSIVNPGHGFVSPTTSNGNNPDLINDTKVLGSGELATLPGEPPLPILPRPGSGEYSRETCDSLYPSGLWEQSALRDASSEMYLGRVGNVANQGYHYDDKTPIIGNGSVDGSTEELGYASRTFPRTHATHNGYPPDYGLPMMSTADHQKVPQPGAMPAKTLRVWQRSGVPVLPPVTALKRALANSRSSPDEGYQEGCGTDV